MTRDPLSATQVEPVAEEAKDPYLELAKEVRDKVGAIVQEADDDGGLQCLINCTDRNKQGEVFWWFRDALHHIQQAHRCLTAVVVAIEPEAKARSGVS